MFRRNQVVLYEATIAWWIPARILKRVSEEECLIINTLGRLTTAHVSKLKPALASDVERYDDQGSARSRYPVTRRMPSLRKLKQAAAWYYSDVWKKPKRNK